VANHGRELNANDTLSGPRDDFTRIAGIGRAIARRLQDAGVQTYADLGELSPEELAQLLSNGPGVSAQRIMKEDWRNQAKELAARPPDDKRQLGDNRHYESFVVRLLLNHNNEICSTTIEHIRSGKVERWAGWEPAKFTDFLQVRASLHSPAPTEAPAPKALAGIAQPEPATQLTTKTESSPTAVMSFTLRPERHVVRALEPFTVSLLLDLDEVSSQVQAALDYVTVVVAKPLHGGSRHTIAETYGKLALGSSLAVELISDGLPEGIYLLEAAVSLRTTTGIPPTGLAASTEGEILQVLNE
jgi:hypothetical protein